MLFQRLQPYCGCHWAGTLRDISNPDKHRTLTLVDPVKTATFPPMQIYAAGALTTNASVDMDVEVAFEVKFGEGTPVVETLEVLQSEVASVLDSFKSEFKR